MLTFSKRARETCLGISIGARRALGLGLVSAFFPSEKLDVELAGEREGRCSVPSIMLSPAVAHPSFTSQGTLGVKKAATRDSSTEPWKRSGEEGYGFRSCDDERLSRPACVPLCKEGKKSTPPRLQCRPAVLSLPSRTGTTS